MKKMPYSTLAVTGEQFFAGGKMLFANGCGSAVWAALDECPWPLDERVDLAKGSDLLMRLDPQCEQMACAAAYFLILAAHGSMGVLSERMRSLAPKPDDVDRA